MVINCLILFNSTYLINSIQKEVFLRKSLNLSLMTSVLSIGIFLQLRQGGDVLADWLWCFASLRLQEIEFIPVTGPIQRSLQVRQWRRKEAA